MKTKTIIAVLAVVAIISLGASKVGGQAASQVSKPQGTEASLGGIAADEK